MKHEEAIEVLRWAINRLEGHHYIIDDNGTVYPSAKVNAFGMAIEALEKQIPKKIVKGKDLFWEYQCPNTNCDTQFTKHASYAFCPGCGQALDWSVNE